MLKRIWPIRAELDTGVRKPKVTDVAYIDVERDTVSGAVVIDANDANKLSMDHRTAFDLATGVLEQLGSVPDLPRVAAIVNRFEAIAQRFLKHIETMNPETKQ